MAKMSEREWQCHQRRVVLVWLGRLEQSLVTLGDDGDYRAVLLAEKLRRLKNDVAKWEAEKLQAANLSAEQLAGIPAHDGEVS